MNTASSVSMSDALVIGLLAGALFTGIVGTLSWRFVWENGMHVAFLTATGTPLGEILEGPTTRDLEWLTWIVYKVIPFGSYLMNFRFLQVTVAFLRTGELPHHDHGHVDGLEEDEPLAPGNEDPICRMNDNLHPYGLDKADQASHKGDPK